MFLTWHRISVIGTTAIVTSVVTKRQCCNQNVSLLCIAREHKRDELSTTTPPPPPGDTYLHVVHCGPAARAHVARGRCPVATFRQLILVFRGITAQHCESPDPLNNAVTPLPLLLPPPHLCMGRYWSVLPLI